MNEIHERSIKESDFATVLCDDLKLDGKLRCAQPILLNCRFEGTLVGDDLVVVYRDASFKGAIHARSIRVAGQVEGDLYATELVELESSGGVYGNITAPSIVMENGSVFEGQSHILRKDKRLQQKKTQPVEQVSTVRKNDPPSQVADGADQADRPDKNSVSAEPADKNSVSAEPAGKDAVSAPPQKQKLATAKKS